MITIEGLTRRQRAFCDALWIMETQQEVDAFIDTLPADQQQECLAMVQMMIAATLDEVTDTDLGRAALDQFML